MKKTSAKKPIKDDDDELGMPVTVKLNKVDHEALRAIARRHNVTASCAVRMSAKAGLKIVREIFAKLEEAFLPSA